MTSKPVSYRLLEDEFVCQCRYPVTDGGYDNNSEKRVGFGHEGKEKTMVALPRLQRKRAEA